MKPELQYLAWTAALTAVLWIPYIPAHQGVGTRERGRLPRESPGCRRHGPCA